MNNRIKILMSAFICLVLLSGCVDVSENNTSATSVDISSTLSEVNDNSSDSKSESTKNENSAESGNKDFVSKDNSESSDKQEYLDPKYLENLSYGETYDYAVKEGLIPEDSPRITLDKVRELCSKYNYFYDILDEVVKIQPLPDSPYRGSGSSILEYKVDDSKMYWIQFLYSSHRKEGDKTGDGNIVLYKRRLDSKDFIIEYLYMPWDYEEEKEQTVKEFKQANKAINDVVDEMTPDLKRIASASSNVKDDDPALEAQKLKLKGIIAQYPGLDKQKYLKLMEIVDDESGVMYPFKEAEIAGLADNSSHVPSLEEAKKAIMKRSDISLDYFSRFQYLEEKYPYPDVVRKENTYITREYYINGNPTEKIVISGEEKSISYCKYDENGTLLKKEKIYG